MSEKVQNSHPCLQIWKRQKWGMLLKHKTKKQIKLNQRSCSLVRERAVNFNLRHLLKEILESLFLLEIGLERNPNKVVHDLDLRYEILIYMAQDKALRRDHQTDQPLQKDSTEIKTYWMQKELVPIQITKFLNKNWKEKN